jgi:hypothetical protein
MGNSCKLNEQDDVESNPRRASLLDDETPSSESLTAISTLKTSALQFGLFSAPHED